MKYSDGRQSELKISGPSFFQGINRNVRKDKLKFAVSAVVLLEEMMIKRTM